MTHSEKRSNPIREAQLALFTGGIFGAVHTISGHPLDTIKSKMQIDKNYFKLNTFQTAGKILKDHGAVGYFRGIVPPLWGSTVYRAVMLSAYEFAFTYFGQNFPSDHFINQDQIGYFRPVVLASAFFASTVRSGLENPIEYAKVMGQTQQKWVFKDIYRGLTSQVIRNTGMLLPIFVMVDVSRRHTDWMKQPAGIFAVTCGSASAGYLLSWPLETLKNLAQTGTPHPQATVAQRMAHMGGFSGLYRGVWPGTICGGFRNGCAMMVMGSAQKWATHLGLRD
jgi:solute carrier family 25 carnitine/acylcarnitine transporter 20/29